MTRKLTGSGGTEGPRHRAGSGRHRAIRSTRRTRLPVTIGVGPAAALMSATLIIEGTADPSGATTTAPMSTPADVADAVAVGRSAPPSADSSASDAALEDRRLPRASRSSARAERPDRPAQARAAAIPGWLRACGRPTGVSAPNGLLASSDLCHLPVAGDHALRRDAAEGFSRLQAAYVREFGGPPCLTDSYRSLEEQQALYRQKPGLAARPGTSNHGWGVALDLCGGVESFSSAEHAWMRARAARWGWVLPDWAESTGSRPEPWHWEYVSP